MKKLEKLEQEIQALPPEEAAAFRVWFLEFDWNQWDRQLEHDVEAGKLDALADEALRIARFPAPGNAEIRRGRFGDAP